MTPRMIVPTVILILVPAIGIAQPGHKAAGDSPKANLIAKTPDVLVHALPHSKDFAWIRQPVAVPGFRLLLTQLPSGEMATLFETRTTNDGHRRLSYNQTRLLGAIVDDQRLYILVGTIHQMDTIPSTSETFAMASLKKDASQNRASIQLLVFWLKDGSQIASRELASDNMPKEISKETADAGPLALVKNGVKFYGNTATFDGKTEAAAK
jgi:hypothetical protein